MRVIPHAIRVNVFFMLFTGAANATVLTTSAVTTQPFEKMTCHLLNLSAKEQSVKLEILDAYTGTGIYENSITVPPGRLSSVLTDSPQVRTLYCRFTAAIPKTKLRGGIANETTGVSFPIQ